MRLDFGEVLSRAWYVTWRFKVLWIFGILASCGRGGSNSNSSSDSSTLDSPSVGGFEGFQSEEFVTLALIVVGVILFVILVMLIVTAISTVGRLGLIRGTVLADQGEEPLTFMELFNEGKPFFWRSFWLNLLVALVILLVVLVSVVAFVAFGLVTAGLGLFLIIPLICILIPIGFFFGIYLEQANIALVIEDISIRESFGKGWEVFKSNLGPLFVMGLILIIGVLIATIIISLPFILILAPVLFAGSQGIEELLSGGAMLTLLLCCAYLPILLLLNGLVETYRQSSWVLAYLRLTGREAGLPELEAGTA